MTGYHGTGGPDIELLADLDAGLLDADRARRVRAAASADPAATAVLDALAATRAELAATPIPDPPPGAAARWAAALESARLDTTGREATPLDSTRPDSTPLDSTPLDSTSCQPTRYEPTQHGTTPHDATRNRTTGAPHPDRPTTEPPIRETRTRNPRPARPRTPISHRRRTPPLIAAGLLTLLICGAALWPRSEPTRIAGIELAAAGRSAVGSTDLGPLADPTRRAGCLRAVAPPDPTPDLDRGPDSDPGPAVIGGRQVELDGRRGVLLVLSTGELGVFRIIVVDRACGPAGGTLLGTTTVGR